MRLGPILNVSAAVIVASLVIPAAATAQRRDRDDRVRDERRDVREARRDVAETRREANRDVRQARRTGDRGDVREARQERREDLQEAREELREEQRDLQQAERRADRQDERREARLDRRDDRRDDQLARRRARWREFQQAAPEPNRVRPAQINANVRQELQVHAQRLARLQRIKTLSMSRSRPALVARANAAITAENRRHVRALARARRN